MEDKLWLSALILGFGVLVKIQTGFLAIILLFALIRKKNLVAWITSVCCGLLTFIVTVVPFIPENENIFWIFNLATRTITQYPYASMNAFNLIGLFGGNWQPLDHTLFFIKYSTWGFVFGGLILAIVTALYFTMRNGARNYVVSFVFITFLFLFMPGMHERYIYPALLLALMSFVHMKKKAMFVLFAGYSLTYYVNIAYVLDFFMRGQYIFGGDAVLITVSILNLAMASYPVKLIVDSLVEKYRELRAVKRENALDPAAEVAK
jgi:Gpi18-like mannosyltransferase